MTIGELTDEILINFGFDKSIEYHIYGNYYVFVKGIIFIHTPRPDQKNGQSHKECPNYYLRINTNIVEIKSVDHLKTLYEALTNETLTLQP